MVSLYFPVALKNYHLHSHAQSIIMKHNCKLFLTSIFTLNDQLKILLNGLFVFLGYIKELPHNSTFKKPYLFKKY